MTCHLTGYQLSGTLSAHHDDKQELTGLGCHMSFAMAIGSGHKGTVSTVSRVSMVHLAAPRSSSWD